MAFIDWKSIEAFAIRHQDGLELFALAMAVTMRKTLPWPLNRIELLEWFYEWLRDGLLTFVSLRGPAHSEAAQTTSTTVVKDDKGYTLEASIESTKSTESSKPEAIPPPPLA